MKSRHAHIFPREENSHYVEECWCDTRLLEVEDLGAPGALILDPAAGLGRIPRAAAAAGYTAIASDIVDHFDRNGLEGVEFGIRNFLTDPPICRPWSVACNPPFHLVREFCERAIAIAKYKAALIIPLRRLPAAHWLKHLPLETIYLLTPRPSMPPGHVIEAGGKPSGGSQDFAWLIFNKRTTPIAPRVRWLHRDHKFPAQSDAATAGQIVIGGTNTH